MRFMMFMYPQISEEDWNPSAEDMEALDEASKLAVEYPAWMEMLGPDRRQGERRY